MKSAKTNKQQPTILLVEDDEQVRSVLQLCFQYSGFCVLSAANGFEAIDLYKKNVSKIDLVLMDVSMPGLDGPQTFEALKAVNPCVRGCFMTGNLGNYTMDELSRMGCMEVLMKPFESLNKIADRIRGLVQTAGE